MKLLLTIVIFLVLFANICCSKNKGNFVKIDCVSLDTMSYNTLQKSISYKQVIRAIDEHSGKTLTGYEYRKVSVSFNHKDSLVGIVKKIPYELGCMKYIKRISIVENSGLDLKQLFTVLSEISNLEELALIGDNIQEIPNQFDNLNNLSVLILNYNKIQKLPSSTSKLKNLKELHIANNVNLDVNHFFALIQDLPIEYLDLGNCGIANLPKEIGKMKYLKTIVLHGNPLTILPCEINNLKNCRFILPKEMPKSIIPPCLKDYPFEFQ